MKKPFMILPLVLVLCFIFSCQQAEEVAEGPVVDVEADVEAIKAFVLNDATVINSGDLDGWLAQFTDDAVFMMPNADVVKGVETQRQVVQPLFEMFDYEMSITVDEVEVYGDWAFSRWSYTLKLTPKAGGDSMQDKGKEIWIIKRQADGTWKCSHAIWNSDMPPQA